MPQMAEMTRSHKVTQASLQHFNDGISKKKRTNKAKQKTTPYHRMPQMAEMTRSHKVTQALLLGFNSGIFQEKHIKN